MEIQFSSPALARSCNSEKELIRRWGRQRGRLIARRLQQLSAATALKEMEALPAAKLQALKGSRGGQFAVDADYPYRLVFVAVHNPAPALSSGRVDLGRVTKIKVTEVINYHDD
jgi:plasmid maintenance system killer protein